ncbi:hypothetical protein H6G36_25610 [Anabaena minutissima FACHB-250]|nr:hypothetical protein [Anabaena minutissima FACHB-250]
MEQQESKTLYLNGKDAVVLTGVTSQELGEIRASTSDDYLVHEWERANDYIVRIEKNGTAGK